MGCMALRRCRTLGRHRRIRAIQRRRRNTVLHLRVILLECRKRQDILVGL